MSQNTKCSLSTIPAADVDHVESSMMHRHVLARTLREASPFFLIAGPCVLESEQVVMAIADRYELLASWLHH